jgi:gliding motility-associated-like protein
MNRRILFTLFLFLIAISVPLRSGATHLMGGSLNYEYLGIDTLTGNYSYEITLTIYRLCDQGSALLPIDMNLGVYEDDPVNPSGDKQLVLNTVIPLFSQQAIVPPNANDTCTFAPNVCVEEGVYKTTIALAPNNTGYYFISDRCCRNNNIANLANPGNAGQAYYAFATDPTIANSSPTFAVAPVPFICANDTISILNQAFDPDGDLLVYNFVTPYNGVSAGGNPNPNPPILYPWTIPTVNYNPNYSVTQPFGPGGSATINSSTGLAAYYAQNQGFYVLAVEIEEYRNGVLVGVSRRDLQIIVISCPVNPAPNLSPLGSPTSFTIQEGDTLCFDLSFSDANGDSIFITTIGDILDPNLTNPAATVNDTSGTGVVTTEFCWATSCDQGSIVPYQFTAIVNDNGCPAKTTNVVYTITVENTENPTAITGPDTLCIGAADSVIYGVHNITGYTFSWLVTNGTINGASDGPDVAIDFSTPGIATIQAVAISPNGCPSDTVTKQVVISPQPGADAGTDITACSGTIANLGGPSTPGVTYSWSPATGLNTDTISNPTVTLNNPLSSPITTTYILTTNQDGCTNSDTVQVTTNPLPVAAAGPDKAVCSGDTITIGLPATPGGTYTWSPSGGLSSDTIAEPFVILNDTTGVADTLQYIVTVTNMYGCIRPDTVNVILNPAPVAVAGPDTVICSGESFNLGDITQTGYSYTWTPSTGLSNDTISDPLFTGNNPGTNSDTLFFVLTTDLGPCTDSDTVMVVVKPLPISDAGSDTTLCSGSTVMLGTGATPGYTYSWTPNTWMNFDTIPDPTINVVNSGSSPISVTYTVTTELDGCFSSDSVTVNVSPVPLVTASASPLTVCAGDTVVLSGTGATTYSWATSTSPSNPFSTDSTTIVFPTDTITYILTGTNAFTCEDIDSVVVFVNPLPNVQLTFPTDTICAGDTIQLTGGGASVYDWFANGIYITTASNIQVSPTTTTTYNLIGTNINNCQGQDSVTIHVNPAATLAAITGAISVCPGVQGVPYDILNPVPNSSYNWTITNGTVASGQGTPSITVNWGATPGTGIVTVTETTTDGCTSEPVSLLVTVNTLLTPQAPAGPDVLCADVSQGIIYNAFTTPGSSYNWFAQGGSIVSGNGTPNVTVNWNVTGPQVVAIWYQEVNVTAVDSCFGPSDTLFVTINPSPVTSAITGPAGICVTDTGSFSVTNTPGSTYDWSITGGSILSGNGSNAVTADWQGSGIAVISVVETDSIGCIGDTVSFNININALPSANAGPDTSVCTGQGIQLNASGGSVYTWSPATGLSQTNIPDPIASPVTATTYTVIVTDTNGCVNSDSLLVTVNSLPVVSTSADTSICLNDSTQISASGGTGYQWSPSGSLSDPGISSPFASPASTTIYTVVVTDQNGCIDSSTVTVTVNPLPATGAIAGPSSICVGDTGTFTVATTPNSTYSWQINNGSILSGDGTNSVTASWNTGGSNVIWVTETSTFGCVGDSVSFSVTVNDLPVAEAGTNEQVCLGESVQLNATGGTTYLWTPATGLSATNIPDPVANPATTTQYTVLVTDGNGCRNSDSVTVTVNPLPSITITPDTDICITSSIQLNAGGGTAYTWSPATTLDDPGIPNPVATPVSTTTYTVTVTDVNGCIDSSSVTITVNPLPVIVASGDTTICEGTGAVITATGGVTYAWSPSGSLSNSNISNPVASPVVNTTYTVTGTDANGCSNEDMVTVNVNITPEASFYVDDFGLTGADCNGYEAMLVNTSIDALAYSWLLPDGSTSTAINPTVQFAIAGNNVITLIAYNNMCTDTAVVTYQSTAAQQIFDKMPNVFTPNGDGLDECFDLGAEIDLAACSKWMVLNRWGTVVFTNSPGKPCWNGKKENSGEDLPAGTYYLIVDIAGEKYQGTITMIR